MKKLIKKLFSQELTKRKTIKQLFGQKAYLHGAYDTNNADFGKLTINILFDLRDRYWDIYIKKQDEGDEGYKLHTRGPLSSGSYNIVNENTFLTEEVSPGSRTFNIDFSKYKYPSSGNVEFKYIENLPSSIAHCAHNFRRVEDFIGKKGYFYGKVKDDNGPNGPVTAEFIFSCHDEESTVVYHHEKNIRSALHRKTKKAIMAYLVNKEVEFGSIKITNDDILTEVTLYNNQALHMRMKYTEEIPDHFERFFRPITIKELIGLDGYLTGQYTSTHEKFGPCYVAVILDLQTKEEYLLFCPKDKDPHGYTLQESGQDIFTEKLGNENFLQLKSHMIGHDAFRIKANHKIFPAPKGLVIVFEERDCFIEEIHNIINKPKETGESK